MATIMTVRFIPTPVVWSLQQIIQQTTPASSDGAGSGGNGLGIDNDGDQIILGLPDRGADGETIYFDRTGSTWTEREQFASPASNDDHFGSSAALNDAGDIAVIGDRFADGPNNTGRAQIYTRSGSTWSLAQTFTGGSTNDQMGITVAIDASGTRAITNDEEFVRVFRDNGGGTWVDEQTIDVSFNNQAMAINAAGDTLVTAGGSNIEVWTRSGTTWTQQGSNITRAGFNSFSNIAITSDGDKIVAIDGTNDLVGTNHGAVGVWTRSGSVWSFDQEFGPNSASDGDQFNRCSVSGDGTKIAIGAPSADNQGINDGAVQVFNLNGGTYQFAQQLDQASATNNDLYGDKVVLSRDGNYLAVNCPFDDLNVSDAGSVYVWVLG